MTDIAKKILSLLQLLVNRTKRKRRRKRVEKGAALTGSERVKVMDIRTGKKVREELNVTLLKSTFFFNQVNDLLSIRDLFQQNLTDRSF